MQAYSPLGAGTFRKNEEPNVLQDGNIAKIAQKHNKTPAQICLRWNVQRGCCVILANLFQ